MEPRQLARRWEELLCKMRKGDTDGAKVCLEWICQELKQENCDNMAKIYTLELMLNISGELKQNPQIAQKILELDYEYLRKWENKEDIEQFCEWVKNDVLEGYLMNLSGCLVSKNRKIVHIVQDYIEQYYGSRLTLEDLARKVYLSPYYLTRIFKKETGCRIFDYLTNVRLKWAKEFLANTDLKVTEVALRVGFEDVSYFGKVFRREIGVTPSEYRDLHQNNMAAF